MTNALRTHAGRMGLAAEVLGSPGESALESAHKAGVMPVTDRMSDFLDREVTHGEKLRRFLQPSFRDQAAQLSARLLLEQSLQIRWTQRYLQRQLTYRIRGLRLNHLDHLTQAAFPNLEC